MAVASDLPDLENRKEYQDARNSVLVDSQGQTLGVLTNNQSRVLVRYQDLSSVHDQRDHRHRGPPLLRELGRRRARHRPRPRAGRAQPQGGAGRLDHRPAVRQERPARAVRPHRVPEDARGGAGLPPHAQVAQEQDPHRVPQLDLLRQRRLRRRVGGAHLLRQPARPPGLRHAQRTCASSSSSPTRPRSSPASWPTRRPTTPSPTRRRPSRGATSCSRTCSTRACSRCASTATPASRRSPRRSTSSRPRCGPRPPTSRPGSASSSSTSSAPARRSRAG